MIEDTMTAQVLEKVNTNANIVIEMTTNVTENTSRTLEGARKPMSRMIIPRGEVDIDRNAANRRIRDRNKDFMGIANVVEMIDHHTTKKEKRDTNVRKEATRSEDEVLLVAVRQFDESLPFRRIFFCVMSRLPLISR